MEVELEGYIVEVLQEVNDGLSLLGYAPIAAPGEFYEEVQVDDFSATVSAVEGEYVAFLGASPSPFAVSAELQAIGLAVLCGYLNHCLEKSRLSVHLS